MGSYYPNAQMYVRAIFGWAVNDVQILDKLTFREFDYRCRDVNGLDLWWEMSKDAELLSKDSENSRQICLCIILGMEL